MLEVFLGNLGRVLTKEDLADKIYTFEEAPSLNAIEQAITRLRRKTRGSPLVVKTARGLGYIADIVEGEGVGGGGRVADEDGGIGD